MFQLRCGVLRKRPLWICVQCRAHSSVASRAPSPPSVHHKRNHKRELVPDKPARTRFAPSPTGYLHLGSLRTALFNYLLAKRTGGQFILRIEDTDQPRTIPGAEERLYTDLQWAGLQWDEGPLIGGPYGPYRQSERTAIYQKHANDLIHSGHAYRCFCSVERLDNLLMHRKNEGLPLGYDRQCFHTSAEESEERAAKGEQHIIRLKGDSYPTFDDIVFGRTGQDRDNDRLAKELSGVYEDRILLKSDGTPTYHLANVVDDHLMKITHVIRGTEWLSSTPLHVALYRAFNWTPPQFAHVPLLVDQHGQKLSKREANIDISYYRDTGILPSTLVNYAALLGWSHSSKSDLFTLKELEEIFTLKITKGNTIVSAEKMWFLQKGHAKQLVAKQGSEFERLIEAVVVAGKQRGIEDSPSTRETLSSLLRHDAGRYTTPDQFLDRNWAFFTKSLDRAPYALQMTVADLELEASESPVSVLQTVATTLTLVPEDHWNAETISANLASLPTSKKFKKELYGFLRWALLAGASGPGAPQTMEILGRAETIRRLAESREVNNSSVEKAQFKGRIKLH